MCDTCSTPPSDPEASSSPKPRSVKRRSILTAALAGTGVAVAATVAGATPASAVNIGPPRLPLLPVMPDQPKKGTVLTMLGTAGGPQAEYVRTGTSSVLSVDGYNYLIDAGRGSVTQYINSGLLFGKLTGMFMTHLHADHLADFYNYFLLEGGQANAEGDRLPYPREEDLPPAPPRNATVGPLFVFGPGSAGALPVGTPPVPPPFEPSNPVPGIKDLIQSLNKGYAYSYNVFERGDGYQPITELQQHIKEIDIPASVGASSTNRAPIMNPFTIFADAQVQVSAILVPHGSVFPCFAYRFDTAHGSVVFSGDTSCPGYTAETNNVIKLAKGADILVHEVMNWDLIAATEALKKPPQTRFNNQLLGHLYESHTRTDQVGRVATAAGVPQLALTHLIPANPRDCPDWLWTSLIRPHYTGKIHVGNDRDQIQLPIRR